VFLASANKEKKRKKERKKMKKKKKKGNFKVCVHYTLNLYQFGSDSA
jgi:hypothetical protein